MEPTAFVSPKWVPQMANASDVMQGISNSVRETTILSCLVPNLQGFERAVQAGANQVAIFASASETFSQKNINCSIDESMKRFQVVINAAKEQDIPVRGYVSCVLGCPYEGATISPARVASVAGQLVELGCCEISLGDTIGIGTPGNTVTMLEATQATVDTEMLAVHFHDTYGQALANIYASLLLGVSTIDASVSGLGGCPYAPGAAGNVATEDVVYMLNGMGIQTGIDLDKLIDAGSFISNVLDRESRSKVAKAMTAKRNQS